jgi:hypothetical protein
MWDVGRLLHFRDVVPDRAQHANREGQWNPGEPLSLPIPLWGVPLETRNSFGDEFG